jgi:hypothetical protein
MPGIRLVTLALRDLAVRKALPCLLGAARLAAKPPGPILFIVAKAVSLRVLHACTRDDLINRVTRQPTMTYVLLLDLLLECWPCLCQFRNR